MILVTTSQITEDMMLIKLQSLALLYRRQRVFLCTGNRLDGLKNDTFGRVAISKSVLPYCLEYCRMRWLQQERVFVFVSFCDGGVIEMHQAGYRRPTRNESQFARRNFYAQFPPKIPTTLHDWLWNGRLGPLASHERMIVQLHLCFRTRSLAGDDESD